MAETKDGKYKKSWQNVQEQHLALESEFPGPLELAQKTYRDLHSGESMPDAAKISLLGSLERLRWGWLNNASMTTPRADMIASASADPSDVTNPVAKLFTLMSIIIPNQPYLDTCAVQPMKTKESPLYYLALEAANTRNGVNVGDDLLGVQSWNANNNYTDGRYNPYTLVVTDTSPTGYAEWVTTLTTEKPLRPNTVHFYWRDDGVLKHAIDDGVGGFTGTGISAGNCSVNYATGVITIRTDADTVAAEDEAWLDFRWFNEDSDAAQVRLTWISRLITAYPRRIRSIQDMDDVKMVKEALDGFDIDKVMQTALGGYINKEISGSILNNILAEATGGVTWDSAVPTGSEWAFHRLSLLQPLREARNSIRQNISRGGGNVIIAGTDLMNLIEDFGESLWKPISQKSEPIGPYTAGTLAGTYKVIKNQDYPDDKVAMVYKGSDMEASYGVGVHIGLYATDLYQLDDFKERQGMATRIGETLMFDNSVTEMTITYTP